ncbi:MAG: PEGA domain-containing protein [Candidatus Eremiobacterota bacterium]
MSVKANVSDAKVLLYRDKERFEGTGSVKPTQPGTYTLKVTAAGYKPYVKIVKVTGKHNLSVYLTPEPQPAYEPAPVYSGGDGGGGDYEPAPYYPPSGGGGGGGGSYQIPSGGL